jgi:hypothetical protein
MRVGTDTFRAPARYTLDERFKGKHFKDDFKVLELVDYVGDGKEVDRDANGVEHGNWMKNVANALEVKYTACTSFVHTFLGATWDSPVIVDIGELPCDKYDSKGDPISDEKISMAGMFANSNLQMLPRGGSRNLVWITDAMFSGCSHMRHWGPEALVAAGLAMVPDHEANRRLRSNGLDESAFLLNIAPGSMKQMFYGCTSYNGHTVNAISWDRIQHEDGAEDFAAGCSFSPVFLNALVDRMHWDRFRKKSFRIPRLRNVNLGHGHLTGEHAQHARELIDSGIELTGITIG